MWNDRDCETRNFFLCERPLIDGNFFFFLSQQIHFSSSFLCARKKKLFLLYFLSSVTVKKVNFITFFFHSEPTANVEINDCNKTIHLSRDRTKIAFSSPGFPRNYPDNINCLTFLTAPNSYRILIEFEELVVENEPQCSYDFLEIFEPTITSNASREAKQNLVEQKLIYDVINGFPSMQQQQQIQQFEFQQLLNDYMRQQAEPKNIFQPSNSTYNLFVPPPSTLSDRMPRRICGDWSSKLKLLRYRTKSNLLGIRFTSDYSHHFSGFKAKISMEKG